MPYSHFSFHMDKAAKTEGWQLNVAIDPSVLIESNANNKIAEIKAILKKISRKYLIDSHFFVFADEQEISKGVYDGTISNKAKQTYRGQEIILCLPNQDKVFANLTYERLVLELWSELQKARVPLHRDFLPGTYPILDFNELPTPFSVSKDEESNPKERYSLLFREAVTHTPTYPLTTLQLTQQALTIYKIAPYGQNDMQREHESFVKHREMAMKCLANDLKALRRPIFPRQTMKEILNDPRLVTSLYEYQRDKQRKLAPDSELLSIYPTVERLLDHYPYATDSDFFKHEAILQLASGSLQRGEISEQVNLLRRDYDAQLNAIKEDFRRHAAGNNRSPRSMTIDWSLYLPNVLEREINEFIERYPAAMQSFYRRIVLLERERLSHEELKKQWLRLNYLSSSLYKQLSRMDYELQRMQSRAEVSQTVLQNFLALYKKIENELLIHPPCKGSETAFPIVLNHFTAMARRLNSEPTLSFEKVKNFARRLQNDLAPKPVDIALRVCIAGCIGALIGLAIGTALTCWGGGFGGIPGAILGMTIAQAFILGGSILFFSTGAATIGFFSARKNKQSQDALDDEKQKIKDSLIGEMNEVHNTLAEQAKSYDDEPMNAKLFTLS